MGCVIACFARDDGLRALRVEIVHAAGPPTRYVHTGTQELWPTQEVRGPRFFNLRHNSLEEKKVALGHHVAR